MSTSVLSSERNIQFLSLIVAPVLFAASIFFWEDGEYNVYSGTLIILSMFFWIPALTALFGLLKDPMPRYSVWGLWIAVYGCISGVCFGFLGYLTTIFNISHKEYLEALSHYPVSSQILLFATGPLFPLSIFILGINYAWNKTVPPWIALLFCAGAIAFPVSRILRIVWIAHVADLLLLIPTIVTGFILLKQKR